MDLDLIASIHFSTAMLLTLFILLMTFETAFLKRLAILSIIAFIVPQLIGMTGRWMQEMDVTAIEIILLRQGALSSLAAISYGLILGVLLNFLKIQIIHQFRKLRCQNQ